MGTILSIPPVKEFIEVERWSIGNTSAKFSKEELVPSFIDVSSYWAPCITKQGNLYVLYFALSVWDGIDSAGIGVATSSSPEGPFDIQNGNGKLFQSGEVGVKNSIDPFYVEENGAKYIRWGSF